jgi:hypothetical protein
MARDDLIIELARSQHGLITRAQALTAGIQEGAIDRRTRAGDWEIIGRGVYRLPGAPRTWHQRALALCLSTSGGITSHATAGWLWGLDGISREPPEPLDLLLPHGTALRSSRERVRRTRVWEPPIATRQGIPVTLLTRTLVDLASELSEERLELALDSAFRIYGQKARDALTRRVKSLATAAWPGLGNLRKLLAERDGSFDSAFEVLVKRALWRSSLPTPVHNHPVFENGRFIAKVDFAWPDVKLVLQAHGLAHHLKSSRYRRDQQQESELQACGWRVIKITWRELQRDGNTFVDRLQRAHALCLRRLC